MTCELCSMVRAGPPLKSVIVDFDGTLASKYDDMGYPLKFPLCGKPIPLSLECLQAYKKLGYQVFVITCREDVWPAQNALTIAKKWLEDNGYASYVDYVNEPHPMRIAQWGWRGGKISGDIMHEDKAFENESGGDYDWRPTYAWLQRQLQNV